MYEGEEKCCTAGPVRPETAAENILRGLSALRERCFDLNVAASKKLQPFVVNVPAGPEVNQKDKVEREFPGYFSELRAIIGETNKVIIDLHNLIDRLDV